jgi:hypothetical protein
VASIDDERCGRSKSGALCSRRSRVWQNCCWWICSISSITSFHWCWWYDLFLLSMRISLKFLILKKKKVSIFMMMLILFRQSLVLHPNNQLNQLFSLCLRDQLVIFFTFYITFSNSRKNDIVLCSMLIKVKNTEKSGAFVRCEANGVVVKSEPATYTIGWHRHTTILNVPTATTGLIRVCKLLICDLFLFYFIFMTPPLPLFYSCCWCSKWW